jgi:7-cyano-7-deazaguanine synthase
MKKAVVLLSGGLDSTVTLSVAKSEGFDLYAVSFDYGQRHRIELARAKKGAAALNVKKHLTIKFNLDDIGGSALTSNIEVPKKSEDQRIRRSEVEKEDSVTSELPSFRSVPVTYVPARNTIFLSFALAFAESIGAGDIFIGVNAVDYSGYPDCRPEFINAFESMANLATKASVEGNTRFRVRAPLIDLTKGGIIRKGLELGVDFAKTWSCYDPQKNRKVLVVSRKGIKDYSADALRLTPHDYVPCARCDSCILRAKGFKEAGVKDPLICKVKY